MDALTPTYPRAMPSPGNGMPPENRLDMPVQSFTRWLKSQERPLVAPERARAPWAARAFVFGGAALLTAYGAHEMYQVVSVSRTTVLQWVLLALFTINFSWIALAFTSGLIGFLTLLVRRKPAPARVAQGAHGRFDAGLQRGDRAHLRGAANDL